MILDADTKVLPLLEIALATTPSLATNHLKLLLKVLAVMSVTRSRRTALVVQHVHMYANTSTPLKFLQCSVFLHEEALQNQLRLSGMVETAEHDTQVGRWGVAMARLAFLLLTNNAALN